MPAKMVVAAGLSALLSVPLAWMLLTIGISYLVVCLVVLIFGAVIGWVFT
jgi:hypothetical protein